LALEPEAGAVSPLPSGMPWAAPVLVGDGTGSPLVVPPPRRRSPFALVLSVVWALIPIATFGWGAPFTFTYAALRLRSRSLGVCAGAYTAVAVVSFYLAGNNNDNSWQANAGVAIAAIAGVIGTAQAFVIRERVVSGRGGNDTALGHAEERLRLRERARTIAAKNPSLAHELQIGRPDRSRRFDDGGLVDVNHVPMACLVQVAGIDQPTAEMIVEVRDGVGGFTSVDDVSVTLGLPPNALDYAAGRLIFIR
jgi:DNA uptake protein ComE-like DNA-binding protein